MKLWVLLGVCLLLVYLRTRIRERLEPTDKIKAPGPGGVYDEAEKDRIWSLMPADFQQSYQWEVVWEETDIVYEEATAVRAGKNKIAGSIAEFYTAVYASATAPITESQISAWVETRYGTEMPPSVARLTTTALKIYFVDQAPAVPPPPPPPTADVTTIPSTGATGATGGVATEPVRAPTPPEGPEPAEHQSIPGAPVTITIEIHPDGTTRVTNPRPGATGTPGN